MDCQLDGSSLSYISGSLLASDPTLHTVPHTSHDRAVQDWPERSPDAERCSADDWESNVVFCANPAGQDDEASGDGIADPDAEP